LKKLFTVLLLTIGFLLGGAALASAQDKKITVSPEEGDAIKKIEKAKTLADKAKATDEFLKKFPKSAVRGQAASNLASQIAQTKDDAQIIQYGEFYLTIFTEPAEADLMLPSLIYSYIGANRHKDAFATAEKYFSRHPEDVSIRVRLAIEGSNQLRSGNKDFAAQSRDFSAQAIELIEANKKPADINDANWKEYQTKWLPQLYQTIAVYEFYAGDKSKARPNLEKATQLDASDINSWVLLASLTDSEYQALAMKYNVANAGAERDNYLKQANEKMDAVIEMFARIVALAEGRAEAKQINEQVRQNLEEYYKYRHKNLDGLPELIAKYKK